MITQEVEEALYRNAYMLEVLPTWITKNNIFMRGKDIIVTFNDYNKRLYTQLSEQMIRECIKNQSLLILHLIWQ